jgi:hypothetical protein
MTLKLETEPQETTTTLEGNDSHVHVHIHADGKWKPDKELNAMTDEEKKAAEAQAKLEADAKAKAEATLADDSKVQALAAKEAALNAKQAKLSEAKIRLHAAKLSDEGQLHTSLEAEYVTTIMGLGLDDVEEVKDGQTKLDMHLAHEAKSRGKSVDFKRQAKSPKPDNGSKGLDLSAVRDELTDEEAAKLELTAVLPDDGSGSDEGNELDARSLQIKAKLDCSLDRAQDLAFKMLESEGKLEEG